MSFNRDFVLRGLRQWPSQAWSFKKVKRNSRRVAEAKKKRQAKKMSRYPYTNESSRLIRFARACGTRVSPRGIHYVTRLSAVTGSHNREFTRTALESECVCTRRQRITLGEPGRACDSFFRFLFVFFEQEGTTQPGENEITTSASS